MGNDGTVHVVYISSHESQFIIKKISYCWEDIKEFLEGCIWG